MQGPARNVRVTPPAQAALAVGAPPPGWPEAPGPEAYTGLVGDIVAAIAPHTEADPVAVLAQALVAAGAVVGRGAHFAVEATPHHPNEYVLLVGESRTPDIVSRSRWSAARAARQACDN